MEWNWPYHSPHSRGVDVTRRHVVATLVQVVVDVGGKEFDDRQTHREDPDASGKDDGVDDGWPTVAAHRVDDDHVALPTQGGQREDGHPEWQRPEEFVELADGFTVRPFVEGVDRGAEGDRDEDQEEIPQRQADQKDIWGVPHLPGSSGPCIWASHCPSPPRRRSTQKEGVRRSTRDPCICRLGRVRTRSYRFYFRIRNRPEVRNLRRPPLFRIPTETGCCWNRCRTLWPAPSRTPSLRIKHLQDFMPPPTIILWTVK